MTDQTGTLVCSTKEKSINRSFLCTQNPSGNSTEQRSDEKPETKDVEASENDDTAREMSV